MANILYWSGWIMMIFVLQVLFSKWWLAHHAQGQMEALWRRLTYGGKPARAPAPAAL